MEYKYADFIKEYVDCDIASCTAKERVAYRWTFNSIDNPKNFIPRYLFPHYKDSLKEHCVGYALSMFDEQQQAEDKLNRLCTDKPQLYKKIGTHISSGKLLQTEGVSSVGANDEGHFSFFEAKDTDLSSSFVIVKQVYT